MNFYLTLGDDMSHTACQERRNSSFTAARGPREGAFFARVDIPEMGGEAAHRKVCGLVCEQVSNLPTHQSLEKLASGLFHRSTTMPTPIVRRRVTSYIEATPYNPSHSDLGSPVNVALTNEASWSRENHSRVHDIEAELQKSTAWRLFAEELECARDYGTALGQAFLYAAAHLYLAGELAGRRAEVSR